MSWQLIVIVSWCFHTVYTRHWRRKVYLKLWKEIVTHKSRYWTESECVYALGEMQETQNGEGFEEDCLASQNLCVFAHQKSHLSWLIILKDMLLSPNYSNVINHGYNKNVHKFFWGSQISDLSMYFALGRHFHKFSLMIL